MAYANAAGIFRLGKGGAGVILCSAKVEVRFNTEKSASCTYTDSSKIGGKGARLIAAVFMLVCSDGVVGSALYL